MPGRKQAPSRERQVSAVELSATSDRLWPVVAFETQPMPISTATLAPELLDQIDNGIPLADGEQAKAIQ